MKKRLKRLIEYIRAYRPEFLYIDKELLSDLYSHANFILPSQYYPYVSVDVINKKGEVLKKKRKLFLPLLEEEVGTLFRTRLLVYEPSKKKKKEKNNSSEELLKALNMLEIIRSKINEVLEK